MAFDFAFTQGRLLEVFPTASISSNVKPSAPMRIFIPSDLSVDIFHSFMSLRNLCMKGDSDTGLPSSSRRGRSIIVSLSPVIMSLRNNASRCSAFSFVCGRYAPFLLRLLRSSLPRRGEAFWFGDHDFWVTPDIIHTGNDDNTGGVPVNI